MSHDIIIKNGLYFDGTGASASVRHLRIRDGVIAEVSPTPLDEQPGAKIIDAEGQWVTPGFMETHTHYDAELLVAPSLHESVRHGVTTALVGSCSISMVTADAEDASDLFTRVETVPRDNVLPILQRDKTWGSPKQWVEKVNSLPLGPNLISFLGHSDLRTGTMGLMRATDHAEVPTESEMQQMEATLNEALDVGFLGLSTMRLKWDKLDGDRAWSRSLPSTYAKWSEISRLLKILRRRDRIHQGAPNAANPFQAMQYFLSSIGLIRKALKTTLISALDLKGNRAFLPMGLSAARLVNWLRGNFRWQVLPTPFTVYADGIDVVFFEEFGAGEMALDLKDKVSRDKLLKDKEYRRNFRKFYGEKLSPRVWQRDFGDAIILDAPDKSLIGRNFDEIARERDEHVVDLFLDLVVEHGTSLRWYTTVGNGNKARLKKMVANPDAIITFSDAGAHIRNMAFYNLPLRFFKLVWESHKEGQPIMPMEKAIWRMTGEQADWMGVDAGRIRVGDRADVVVMNPDMLSQELENPTWAKMEGYGFNGLERMVNRNPGIVNHVLINGRVAVDNGEIAPELGKEMGFGRFLPADTKVPGTAAPEVSKAASKVA